MQVESDIKAAIDIINLKKVNKKEYRPVKLFSEKSLKSFKKVKLDDKNVLTKYDSCDEIIDLVSYGANVTCYSSNRLDEYFMNLKLAFMQSRYDEYFSYFFKDYGRVPQFSKRSYLKVRPRLDEKTSYFFDELYNYVNHENIFDSKLCKNKYDYETLKNYIRYFIHNRYNEAQEQLKNRSVKFILSSDASIPKKIVDEKFNFINLSYNLSKLSEEKRKFIMEKIELEFTKMLKENGKIQGFIGNEDIELDGYKKNETKSIVVSNFEEISSDKQYSYIYTKQ